MLRQRVITALLVVPPVAAAILLLPSALIASLFAGGILIAAVEWARIMQRESHAYRLAYAGVTGLCLVVAGLAWHRGDAGLTAAIVTAGAAWWLLAIFWLGVYPRGLQATRPALRRQAVAGVFILVPAWVALVSLHSAGESGPRWLLFLMVLVWAADIGAYFAGKRFGRHKLAPGISPGKTWEGALGGLASAVAVAAAAAWAAGLAPGTLAAFLLLCALVAAVSIVGDLTISMFKRHAGVKDSGMLLPGHGGFLDRIDSLTAAAPVFWLGFKLLLLKS